MMLSMTRRRNLLLWIAFAAITLAALGIVLIVALKPAPTEAERRFNQVRLGMTEMQVSYVLGIEDLIPTRRKGEPFECELYSYADDSYMTVYFDSAGIVERKEIRKRPWFDRISVNLRKAGLPI